MKKLDYGFYGRLFVEGINKTVKCPFCGNHSSLLNAIGTCATCQSTFKQNKYGVAFKPSVIVYQLHLDEDKFKE